jgi:Flp pilus assembly protein CpaB
VGLVVAITLLTARAQVSAVSAARRQWTEVRGVTVALHDLPPGATIDAASVEVRELPIVAIPEGATTEAPIGAVVRYPIMSGEPLLTARLAPDGLTGVAALLPPGHRAVAVAAGPTTRPPLQIGDRVDLLAALAIGDSPDGMPTAPLVESGLVVDISDEAVTVAVPTESAPSVAYAISQGFVVIALTGG